MIGKRTHENTNIPPNKKGFRLGIKSAAVGKMLQIEETFNRENPAVFENISRDQQFRTAGGFLTCTHPGMYGLGYQTISELVNHTNVPESTIFDGSESSNRFTGCQEKWSLKTNTTLLVYAHNMEPCNIIFQIKRIYPGLNIESIIGLVDRENVNMAAILKIDILLVPDWMLVYRPMNHAELLEFSKEISSVISFPFSKAEIDHMGDWSAHYLNNFIWKRTIILLEQHLGFSRTCLKVPVSGFIWITTNSPQIYLDDTELGMINGCELLRNRLAPDQYRMMQDPREAERFCKFIRENLLVNLDFPLDNVQKIKSVPLLDTFESHQSSEIILGEKLGKSEPNVIDDLRIMFTYQSKKFIRRWLVYAVSMSLERFVGTKTVIITQKWVISLVMKHVPDARTLIRTPNFNGSDSVAQCYSELFETSPGEITPRVIMMTPEKLNDGIQFDGISQLIFTCTTGQQEASLMARFFGDPINGFPELWYFDEKMLADLPLDNK